MEYTYCNPIKMNGKTEIARIKVSMPKREDDRNARTEESIFLAALLF